MTDTYPHAPGSKQRGGTSEAAGLTIAPSIRPSHQQILKAFEAYGSMTPDELAVKIGRSVLYTRPRCSELRVMGLLFRTGTARKNESGIYADVLSLRAPESVRTAA